MPTVRAILHEKLQLGSLLQIQFVDLYEYISVAEIIALVLL